MPRKVSWVLVSLVVVLLAVVSACRKHRTSPLAAVNYEVVISNSDAKTGCYQYLKSDQNKTPVQLIPLNEGDSIKWSQEGNYPFTINFIPGSWFEFPGTPFQDSNGNWVLKFEAAAGAAVPSGASILTYLESFNDSTSFYYASIIVNGQQCYQSSLAKNGALRNDIGVIVKP